MAGQLLPPSGSVYLQMKFVSRGICYLCLDYSMTPSSSPKAFKHLFLPTGALELSLLADMVRCKETGIWSFGGCWTMIPIDPPCRRAITTSMSTTFVDNFSRMACQCHKRTRYSIFHTVREIAAFDPLEKRDRQGKGKGGGVGILETFLLRRNLDGFGIFLIMTPRIIFSSNSMRLPYFFSSIIVCMHVCMYCIIGFVRSNSPHIFLK